MKRVISLIAVLPLFFGFSSTIFAQPQDRVQAPAQAKTQLPPIPDFSGKWTVRVIDPNVPPPPPPLGGRAAFGELGQGATIEQTEKTITVITVANGVPTKAVFTLDGTETKNQIAFGGGNTVNRVSTAKWDGKSLVLTTTTSFNGSTTSSSQSWTFDFYGDLLVETTTSVRGTPTKTVTKYQKSS